MYILSFKTGHDPAACLLQNGRIIAAAEEERFNRIKHAPDCFPQEAIKYCLSVKNLTLNDIDYIVFAREKNFKTFLKVVGYFLRRLPRNDTELRYMIALLKVQIKGVLYAMAGQAPYQKIFQIIGGRKRKVFSFDHHLCHAASAYFGSGFDTAAVLCMDGKGEATSISMWSGEEGTLTCLKRFGIFDSLGYLYGSITEFLNFKINDGEYKVMGLAPYGKPEIEFDPAPFVDKQKSRGVQSTKSAGFDDIFSVSPKGVSINTEYSLYPYSLPNLKKRFPKISHEYNEFAPPEPNTAIAATLQDRLEKAAIFYVKKLQSLAVSYQRQATRSVCLAGGVSLNVKMNKAIWDSGLVEKLWVQPAAGDMGNVLGAAWLLYSQKTGKRPEPLHDLYLGAEYSDEQIEKVLKGSQLPFQKKYDIAREVAELLEQGNIVAWFQGRFEFGPRALGSRSILADPRTAAMKEVINAKVKFREPFRPFCPSILEGHTSEILEQYMSSPFMVMSFRVKEEWKKKIPAVVHVDGTVRPQEVRASTNPLYAKMISYFYEKTGVPVVLNTSQNVRGEPIVNTPEEAINFFKKTDVDMLAIGNFVVTK